MSSALGGLDKFNVELLKSNHFCMGVKRGNEYRCGGDAGEDTKSKAVDLLIEAVKRMRRWRVWTHGGLRSGWMSGWRSVTGLRSS